MSLTRGEARERGWLGNKTMPDLMATPGALPLDLVSGALAGYSVARLIRAAYTGPLIRVRRSSDNTEQDISVDASGNLDTAALLAFVGAGSGFLRTLYDQSANALHAGQATTTQQPRIVNSGALDLLNSRPAAIFDGSNDVLFSGAHGSTATSFSSVMVARWTSGGSSEDIAFGPGAAGSTGTGRLVYRGVNSTSIGFAGINADRLTTSTSLDIGGAAHVFAITQSGSSLVFARDGVTEASTLAYGSLVALVSSHSIGIGGLAGSSSYYTAFSFAEGVLHPSQLSASNREALEDSAAWYFNTPATPRAVTQYGVKR